MNTASFTERSFSPTVPLLGSQGWIVAPAAVEPRAGPVEELENPEVVPRLPLQPAEGDHRVPIPRAPCFPTNATAPPIAARTASRTRRRRRDTAGLPTGWRGHPHG